MQRLLIFTLAAFVLGTSGCSGLRSALGTAKNPWETFSEPPGTATRESINPFVQANYEVLRLGAGDHQKGNVGTADERRQFVSAGFALSDHYCSSFFRDADESYRRRRFGRSLTNDVGTIVNGILDAAGAGASAIASVATGFGSADSAWRNYDDAFMVDRNLANVRGLVLAEQDNFRERTLGGSGSLPGDYATAQSAIRRYAEFCSTLGMQSLLTRAAENARTQVESSTTQRRGESDARDAAPPAGTPALTSNDPT